jgi:hypothetical protein
MVSPADMPSADTASVGQRVRALLTPCGSALKVVRGMPCLRLEPVIGCRFRLIERYLHFCFLPKNFSYGGFLRWG